MVYMGGAICRCGNEIRTYVDEYRCHWCGRCYCEICGDTVKEEKYHEKRCIMSAGMCEECYEETYFAVLEEDWDDEPAADAHYDPNWYGSD